MKELLQSKLLPAMPRSNRDLLSSITGLWSDLPAVQMPCSQMTAWEAGLTMLVLEPWRKLQRKLPRATPRPS